MRARAARVTPALVVAALALAGCGAVAAPARVVGQPSTSINVPLQVVACTTRDVCAAFGTSLLGVGPTSTGEFRRASGAWAPLRTPTANGSYVATAACTATACLIGGGASAGDLAWRFRASPPSVGPVGAPPGGTQVEALACARAACALVDSAGSSGPLRLAWTTDVGTTWSAPAEIPGTAGWRATALSCPSATECLLALAAESVAPGAPGGPALLATSDGGATWSVRALPPAWYGVSSLSCGPGRCDALASTARGTLWARSGGDGAGWSSRPVGASATSMACTTSGRCVLVGATRAGPWAATTDGSALRRARLRYVPAPLTAAACGATTCALVNSSTVTALRP